MAATGNRAVFCNQIRERGHDPKKLPKAAPGTAGIKADVRAEASRKLFPPKSKTFDKAWQRLRDNGDIME